MIRCVTNVVQRKSIHKLILYTANKLTDRMLKKPATIEDHRYTDVLNRNYDRHVLVDKARGKQPHLSDLMGSCMRCAMFRRFDPDPKISERTRNYFLDGEAIDEKMRSIFKDIVKEGDFDTDAHIEYGPIIARPDLVDNARKTVIELKSTDPTTTDYLPKEHNLRQLQGYMALMDLEDGVLWYHIISRKQDDNLWKEYHTKMNSLSRSEMRSMLLLRALDWEKAYDEKAPLSLPGVYDDPALSWMCRGDWNEETEQYNYCAYVEQCAKGWAHRQQYKIEHPKRIIKDRPIPLVKALEQSVNQTTPLKELNRRYT